MLTRESIIRKDYTPLALLATAERLEVLELAIRSYRVATMEPGYELSDAERKLLADVDSF